MEKESEQFIRAALHDLANIMAGVRGIVDLADPAQPLSSRDRSRLEAVLDEGSATLERCRHLAMGTLPDAGLEAGADWRERLMQELAPLSVLFRTQVELAWAGRPEADQWPGELGQGLAHAITRLALPQARGGALTIHCAADPEQWRITWRPVNQLPECLSAASAERRDIGTRWILECARELRAEFGCAEGALELRIPRRG
jgi:hypothetical protein